MFQHVSASSSLPPSLPPPPPRPSAAVVQFSQAEYTFPETVSWARVDVTRHGYTSNSSQVKCVIKAGSAQPPMDFQPGDTPQGVLFTAGSTHASEWGELYVDDVSFFTHS